MRSRYAADVGDVDKYCCNNLMTEISMQTAEICVCDAGNSESSDNDGF